jgi:hypothetical protein
MAPLDGIHRVADAGLRVLVGHDQHPGAGLDALLTQAAGPRHAALAVNLGGGMAMFLVETFQTRSGSKPE